MTLKFPETAEDLDVAFNNALASDLLGEARAAGL